MAIVSINTAMIHLVECWRPMKVSVRTSRLSDNGELWRNASYEISTGCGRGTMMHSLEDLLALIPSVKIHSIRR